MNNRYRIDALLGTGGFGAVYLAWDTNLSGPVAVKESLEARPEIQRQFQLEARLLFRLVHSSLPRVHDCFALPGQGMYLVMDYVEGEDLANYLERTGRPLSEADALAWIDQVCQALQYLHSQDPPVIHRDVKPDNIRITPDGKAVLVDFGLAKVYKSGARTTAGAQGVTPGYAPQEQYGLNMTDERSDIYGLGATLYHLLTDQVPTDSINRSLGKDLPEPRSLNLAISPQVEAAILKAMQLLPEQRFASVAEFRTALAVTPAQVVAPARVPTSFPHIPQVRETLPLPVERPVTPSEIPAERAWRNRQNMLQLVWNTWIQGVLEQSRPGDLRLDLSMETRPQAVEHPWDILLQTGQQVPRSLPPGARLLDVFDQASGALLILGEPGSGKTTLLLELAQQAIERAGIDPVQPIPVVFNLSSWSPPLTLAGWLVEELREKYSIPHKIANPWVADDELMLLLDGLDEVRDEHRQACVQAINAFRQEYPMAVAVCCRLAEYEALAARLKFPAAVVIQPLSEAQVEATLAAAGEHLQQVARALHEDHELLELVKPPLMLSLVVLAYKDTPLDELQVLETAEARRSRLFDAYIRGMYQRKSSQPGATSLDQIRTWLGWLASRMFQRRQAVLYLENFHPDWLRDAGLAYSYKILMGSLAGLLVGAVYSLRYSLEIGLVVFVLVWLVVSLFAGRQVAPGAAQEPATPGWGRRFRTRLIYGLGTGLVVSLLFGLLWAPIGRSMALQVGVVAGVLLGFFGGREAEGAARPSEKLRWAWEKARLGLRNGALFGLAGGALIGVLFGSLELVTEAGVFWKQTTLASLLLGSLVGLAIGASMGLSIGGLQSSEVESRIRPGQGAQASLKNAVRVGAMFWLISGFSLALSSWLAFGLIDRLLAYTPGGLQFDRTLWPAAWPQFPLIVGGLPFGLAVGLLIWLYIGLPFGVTVGLFSYGGLFFVTYTATRWLLALAKRFPRQGGEFLDFATERVFLHRAGAGYIFIHRLLMEHFMKSDPPPVRSPRWLRLVDPALLLAVLLLIWNAGPIQSLIGEYYVVRSIYANLQGDHQSTYWNLQRAAWWKPDKADLKEGLCWTGALTGHAAEVLPACDLSIQLAPLDKGAYDARGIARAMLGDKTGAAADFKRYIDLAAAQPGAQVAIARRQAWIAALQAGQNPFDPATVQNLLEH